MRNVYTTREEWLAAARDQITEVFAEAGHKMPPVRIGVAWPTAGYRSNVIGECLSVELSGDKTAEITIRMSVTDAGEILAVLIHEMAHAVNGAGLGHGKEFGALVRPFGLVGKLTSTVPDADLASTLAIMAAGLGAYPMGAFLAAAFSAGPGPDGKPPVIKSSGPKRQKNRHIKAECATCGYTVNVSRRWLTVGLPLCPDGDEMEEV